MGTWYSENMEESRVGSVKANEGSRLNKLGCQFYRVIQKYEERKRKKTDYAALSGLFPEPSIPMFSSESVVTRNIHNSVCITDTDSS